MPRRLFLIMLALIALCCFCTTGYAENAAGYYAQPSETEVMYGQSVTIDITAPSEAASIAIYANGKRSGLAEFISKADGKALWQAQAETNKLGNVSIEFRAYSDSGDLLVCFPSDKIEITVLHWPPRAQEAIILGSDRAVLMAFPPCDCGIRQKEYGFYYGAAEDALDTKVKSNKLLNDCMNKLITGLTPGMTYYYRPYVVTGVGTLLGEIKSFTTPANDEYSAEDAVFEATADRYRYLFGGIKKFYTMPEPPLGYATASEAQTHMVTIEVPVWKLSHGKKTESVMEVTVNRKLQNNVKAIFEEIFALPEQFPVMALKGFSYRHIAGPGLTGSNIMSHHSFGAAIDVNKPHNLFYTRKDKRNTKDPYYITQNVIDIFAKYGWAWGGDFKEGFDTMHFQYLGLDLTGK